MNRREPLGQSFRFRKAGTPVDSEAALAELYQANVNSGALSLVQGPWCVLTSGWCHTTDKAE